MPKFHNSFRFANLLKLYRYILAVGFTLSLSIAQAEFKCLALLDPASKIETVPRPMEKAISIQVPGTTEIVKLPADHPLLEKNGKIRAGFEKIWKLFEGKSPAEVMEMQIAITKNFEDLGMNFKNKKGDVFTPDINPIPATMTAKQFHAVVKGMEPSLRLMREILQVFMSNPEADPNAYGLKHLTQQERLRLIRELKGSLYYEPQSTHKNLKKYNFISVVGVDATLGNLVKHLAHIFEINAGTPSGFANLTLILEAIRIKAPAYFEILSQMLSQNGAFDLLRSTMDQHGKAIMKDGLSVEIGTGVYNGAFPDQAMISYFSGMPLVARNDLFIDSKGFVRLKNKMRIDDDGFYQMGDGKKIKHVGPEEYRGYVQVWSIYSRAEEGAVLNEKTSSDRLGVGFKLPHLVGVNRSLNEKLGLNLAPGTAYQYRRNAQGEVIDVERNEQGKPLVENSWDQFSPDPVLQAQRSEPAQQEPSLLKSVLNGKVYLSNFGSRLVDHKWILSMVTKEIEGRMRDEGIDPKKTLVRTPKEATTKEELEDFYANPHMYVLKVPDESGGVGVRILPTATRAEQQLAVRDYKANPEKYVVQSLADFMSIVGVAKDNGRLTLVQKAFDARIFILLDPQGNAVADPWGVLVRVAKHLSLSTNTSQGADYGILVALMEKEMLKGKSKNSLLPTGKISILSDSHIFYLKDYFISINMLLNGEAQAEATAENRLSFLTNFFVATKTMMSILGPDYSYLVAPLEREFTLAQKEGNVSSNSFNRLLPFVKKVKSQILLQIRLPEGSAKAFAPLLKTAVEKEIKEDWQD